MNTNKNSYTFIYASVMVIIVAFLLAFVSSVLKPIQQKNVELDKKKQVLAALNIFEKDAEAAYATYVKADQLLAADGSVVAENGGFAVENSAVNAENLTDKVTVSQTGCIGICQYEPVFEVFHGEEKTTYVKMTPEKAKEVIASHIEKGQPLTQYTIGEM